MARVCGGGWAARLALGLEDGGDVLGGDGALQLLAVEQLGLDLVPRALALGEGLGALAVAPTKACRGTTQQVGAPEAGTSHLGHRHGRRRRAGVVFLGYFHRDADELLTHYLKLNATGRGTRSNRPCVRPASYTSCPPRQARSAAR